MYRYTCIYMVRLLEWGCRAASICKQTFDLATYCWSVFRLGSNKTISLFFF